MLLHDLAQDCDLVKPISPNGQLCGDGHDRLHGTRLKILGGEGL